ncbi:MAG: PIN domain nuclease [Gaiellaceae bacterium]
MALFLADTSAWHRSGQTEARWSSLLEDDALALCAPVTLELLYSARGPADYRTLAGVLGYLPTLPLDPRAETLAARTQRALAERSQHRGPSPVDLLVAAVAEAHGAVLLHYDRHFDLIVRVTDQPAEWLAPRGSLD